MRDTLIGGAARFYGNANPTVRTISASHRTRYAAGGPAMQCLSNHVAICCRWPGYAVPVQSRRWPGYAVPVQSRQSRQSVKISDELILDARLTAEIGERSIAGQIEFWRNWAARSRHCSRVPAHSHYGGLARRSPFPGVWPRLIRLRGANVSPTILSRGRFPTMSQFPGRLGCWSRSTPMAREPWGDLSVVSIKRSDVPDGVRRVRSAADSCGDRWPGRSGEVNTRTLVNL